ncbi:serpin B13-like [Brevipalpus obovatus]|uniref:serpin B13-like n=1 Tax=Brevipalpus obovatus TaxID=246614 RepID=UPI003D9E295E
MPRKQLSEKTERTLQIPVDGFTIDFLREASKDTGKNIFVSPIGIIVLYTLLLEGAHGKTAEQLMQVFHLKPQFENVEEVRVEMEKLIKRFNQKDQDITVKMANKAVIDVGITLKPSFQKIIQKNYSASIDREDFGDGTVLQEKLNKWVSQETNNLIPQLFDDPPQPSTVLILINVLYFKGLWVNYFEPCNEKDDFYNLDGTKSSVKMMFLEQQKCFYSNLEEEGLKVSTIH